MTEPTKQTRLLSALGGLTPLVKLIVFVVFIALLAWAILATKSCSSRHSDEAIAEREAARATERQQLETERNQAIGRAEAAEKREEDLRAEVLIYETAASVAGEKAIAVAERMKDEDAKFEEDMRDAGRDLAYCDRIRRICERAKRLYPGRQLPSECQDCTEPRQ